MSVILCTDSVVGINTTNPHYTLAVHNSFGECEIYLANSENPPVIIAPGGGAIYTDNEELFFKNTTGTVGLSEAAASTNALLDIPFITQSSNILLEEAQSLGDLTTGLLKNTVASGVGTLSTATAGIDYYAPATPHTLTINNLSNNCDLYLQNTVTIPSIPATGGGSLYTSSDDLFYSGNSRTVNLSKAGSALSTKYIIQQPNSDLPNAQSLSSLTSGLVKNTTTTGILTIGIAGTDYYAPGTPHTLTVNNLSNNCDIYLQNTTNVPSIPASGGGILYTSSNNLFYSGGARTVNLSQAGDALAATYITQSASSFLPNEQSLGALTTGLLKNTVTTGTGVLSQAIPAPLNNITGDYYAPGFPTYIFDEGLTGTFNLFLGWITTQTDRLNVTGDSNIGIGIRCLESLTSGAGNTCFGSNSARTITTGTNNTVIGRRAFLAATVGSSGNTVLGKDAAFLRDSYTNCTFLGLLADASVTSLSNATAIGANSQVSVNNGLVLGVSTTNVGIRTSSPNSPLHLVGTFQQKGIATNYTGTDVFMGQVGIQTTTATPTVILSIPIPTSPAGCLKLSSSFAAMQSTSASGATGNIETGVFYNGTTSTIQGPTGFSIQGPLLWGGNVTVSVVGTNLNINVTGIAGQTLNWVVYYEYFSVRNVIT